jgi:hypothetical protein
MTLWEGALFVNIGFMMLNMPTKNNQQMLHPALFYGILHNNGLRHSAPSIVKYLAGRKQKRKIRQTLRTRRELEANV